MKKYNLFLTIIFVLFLICGCSNSDTGNTNIVTETTPDVPLSPFVGEWYCGAGHSCNGGTINLTITQDGDTLNFSRDMRMSTQAASSKIEFSLKIPTENELEAPDIKGTYVLKGSVLYEVFNNGRQNKFSSKNKTKNETSSTQVFEEEIPSSKTTEQISEATYSTSLPYEGMKESMISSTSLGSPTVSEKCLDFYKLKPSHRHTTYKWYKNGIQDLQHLQAIATVYYWDYENKCEVSGYIHSITIYNR